MRARRPILAGLRNRDMEIALALGGGFDNVLRQRTGLSFLRRMIDTGRAAVRPWPWVSMESSLSPIG